MNHSLAVPMGLAILLAVTGYKAYEFHRSLLDERQLVHDARLEAAEYGQINRGFMDMANERFHGIWYVEGREIGSEGQARFVIDDTTVVYLFATDCGITPANIPVLNDLYLNGAPVVGLVRNETMRSLEVFIRAHEPVFPVLGEPSGPVLDLLPQGAVPLTGILNPEGLMELWLGPYDHERESALRSALRIGA